MEPGIWISGLSALLGAVIGAWSSYSLQRRIEQHRDSRAFKALCAVLTHDIVEIVLLVRDGMIKSPDRPVSNYIALWYAMRSDIARVAPADVYSLLHAFYSACEQWSRWVSGDDLNPIFGEYPDKQVSKAAQAVFERLRTQGMR